MYLIINLLFFHIFGGRGGSFSPVRAKKLGCTFSPVRAKFFGGKIRVLERSRKPIARAKSRKFFGARKKNYIPASYQAPQSGLECPDRSENLINQKSVKFLPL